MGESGEVDLTIAPGARCWEEFYAPRDGGGVAGGVDLSLGYYEWSWGDGSDPQLLASAPSFAVAFSGHGNIPTALHESGKVHQSYQRPPAQPGGQSLPLLPLLAIGGADTRWSIDQINRITSEFHLVVWAGYKGIVYDIEAVDGGCYMRAAFAYLFKATHLAGLLVGVPNDISVPNIMHPTPPLRPRADLIQSLVVVSNPTPNHNPNPNPRWA